MRLNGAPTGQSEVPSTDLGHGPRLLIAIDGPAAAGKTTVARALANRAGATFLDTGLLYRAVTVTALDRGIAVTDDAALTDLVDAIDLDIQPASVADGRPFDVLVDGRDLTARLRTPEVDRNVSAVSAVPGVRAALLPVQRQLASRGRVVMVGRDIATVVAPDAELKIYLDASPHERARRRHAEAAGVDSRDFESVLADLVRRDAADSSRAAAPLERAADAIVIETDGKSVNEIVEAVTELVEAKARELEGPADGG